MRQVDELIRGEMSAVKSIDSILGRIKDTTERSKLDTIRKDHLRAVEKLKKFASSDFDEASVTGGPWSVFTKAFTSGASLFGDKTALRALKMGEEHGLNEYKQVMADRNLNSELKQVISSELLPAQENHLKTINSYLQ